MIAKGVLRIEPIVYEDFLPVSAAGIFQSNLQEDKPSHYAGESNQQAFEQALGAAVYDEMSLYINAQADSLERSMQALVSSNKSTSIS